MKSKPKSPKKAAKKIKKKSVKKAEPVDTSKKIDELLNKAKLAVPGAERQTRDLKGKCPAWMEEYAVRCPNVDISLKPLDFWLGARDFLASSFARAYEANDGDLLKDPGISEALCVLMEEPRALCRKFFYRYTESPSLYGGDYDGDLKRIVGDWRLHFGDPDPFNGYADWFNLMFQLVGESMVPWILQSKKLDASPVFASLKMDISKCDLWEGMPVFPDPFGVERQRSDVSPEELKVFGAGFVTCTHPALRQLLQVAWMECGRRLHGRDDHCPGEWAGKWIREYSPEQQSFVFKDVKYDFSLAPERWKVAQKLIESKNEKGFVFLGNKWRGGWNDKESPAYKFSRYICPPRQEDGNLGPGFFHLMDEPIDGTRSRKSGKRTAAGTKRSKTASR